MTKNHVNHLDIMSDVHSQITMIATLLYDLLLVFPTKSANSLMSQMNV